MPDYKEKSCRADKCCIQYLKGINTVNSVNSMKGDEKIMIYHSLNRTIASLFGTSIYISGRQPIYGGDINQSYHLTLSNGSSVFMKSNDIENYAYFEKETEGLEALRSLHTIGVPKPLAAGVDDADQMSFLLMEYLAPAQRRKDYGETLGHELALMHRHSTKEMVDVYPGYGFYTDNYIGVTPQLNTPKAGWIDFFRDCRLVPQLRMAEKRLDSGTIKKCGVLLDHLDQFLEEPPFPSLLHGDLWSGNVICGSDGKAWILDPAVYVGSFEAEIAMTELFGGYPDSFYDAYQEINRIEPEYEDRRDLYNLYHMLNHLNLFGSSYLSEVRRIVRKYA